MPWLRRTPKDVYGERRAARTVAVTTSRRAAKQGALWGVVFGGTIAASESAYAGLFPTLASRTAMARTFEGNTAWAALFGPLRRLETVAGYTVYKTGMTVIILGAIWVCSLRRECFAAMRTPAAGSCSFPVGRRAGGRRPRPGSASVSASPRCGW